jgi:hypothetical protein
MAIVDDRTSRNYPLPHASNKLPEDVERLREAFTAIDTDMAAALLQIAGKAAAAHVHAMGDVTGLVAALAGKAALAHLHALADLTDTDVTGATNGQLLKKIGSKWQPGSISLADVVGWEGTVASMIAAQVAGLVGGSPATLDTLDELAQALGGDPDFATTIATALGNRLRIDAGQTLNPTQQGQGRSNLGLGGLAVLSSIADAGLIANSILTFAKLHASAVASQAEAEAAAASDKLMTPLRVRQAVIKWLATVEQAEAGTATDVLMTPATTKAEVRKLSEASLTLNGYQKMPSGLIMQWGKFTGASESTVNFPVVFPENVFSVTATLVDPTNFAVSNTWSAAISSITTSGFLARRRLNTSTGGNSINTITAIDINWMALGN